MEDAGKTTARPGRGGKEAQTMFDAMKRASAL
jgi:hypothetical protein